MRLTRDGGVVWGLGMYASGSTWIFNVMLKLAEALAAAALIAVSIRDPLDVVASGVKNQNSDFDEALTLAEDSARQCARQGADQRTLLLRYETGFVDDPATLDRLAVRLGGTLPAAGCRIFTATRRCEIERSIAGLPGKPGMLIHRPTGGLLDPATHWHSHHANRTGEVGRWRRTLTTAKSAIGRDNLLGNDS